MFIKKASIAASVIWCLIILLFIFNFFFGKRLGLSEFLFPIVLVLGIAGSLMVIVNKPNIDAAIEEDRKPKKDKNSPTEVSEK